MQFYSSDFTFNWSSEWGKTQFFGKLLPLLVKFDKSHCGEGSDNPLLSDVVDDRQT